jgi:hypothetical protein
MTDKFCPKCKVTKNAAEFGSNKAKPDGLQSNCKSCRKIFNAAYYQDSKDDQNPKRFARRAEQVKINKEFVYEFLRSTSCVDCSESDIVVLTFDHVRGKKFKNISHLMLNGYSLEAIKREIDKCEVRCANCHARKTARDFGWSKALVS